MFWKRNKMDKHINEFDLDADDVLNHRKSPWEKKRLHKVVIDYSDLRDPTPEEMEQYKEVEKKIGRPLMWGFSDSKLESQKEFTFNDITPPMIREMMKVYSIVPDVFEDAWYPTINLKVDFGGKDGFVYRGNEMAVIDTYKRPSVSYESEPGKIFSLIMFTPDAPANWLQEDKCFVHWRM